MLFYSLFLNCYQDTVGKFSYNVRFVPKYSISKMIKELRINSCILNKLTIFVYLLVQKNMHES